KREQRCRPRGDVEQRQQYRPEVVKLFSVHRRLAISPSRPESANLAFQSGRGLPECSSCGGSEFNVQKIFSSARCCMASRAVDRCTRRAFLGASLSAALIGRERIVWGSETADVPWLAEVQRPPLGD